MKPNKDSSPLIPLTSMELLNHIHTKIKRLREININEPIKEHQDPKIAPDSRDLSTAGIMKLAKQELLQLKSRKVHAVSNEAFLFGLKSNLSSEVSRDLELAMLLKAAAENVARRKFDKARNLLGSCDRFASKNGNPLQRLVHYFSEALREKMDQESGKISSYHPEIKSRKALDVIQAKIHLEPTMMGCQQELPFHLETQYFISQTILDSVGSAKKVHLIDFGIGNGSHLTLVMQSLASRSECPLELLKTTAVGTCKEMLEVTGNWLSSFAQTIKLPFSFEIVISDQKDVKVDFFELDPDEVLAISGLRLWSLLGMPNCLQSLLQVIRGLKPCVVAIREFEASTNTQNFVERFHEAVVLFGVFFDSMEECADHYHVLYRKMSEEVIFRRMIRNIVVSDGAERYERYERIGFWRTFFSRFGMVEVDLSGPLLSQVAWLFGRSSRFRNCTVESDGKCLIIGWKRTPLMSLSAWKFIN